LLGVRGLGTNEHYQTAELPQVNEGLLSGRLAWRQHDGGHTDGPNWKYFIPWADRELAIAENSAAVPWPRTDPNSHLAHQDLLAKAQGEGVIDLYFVGDSITRRWGALDYPELLDHWNETFFGWNAANFAWGGDQTQNILWRLANGEMQGVEPKVIVIQAGTNNVGGRPGGEDKIADIVAGIDAIIASCRERAPEAELVLTAIFPRSERPVVAEIEAINDRIELLAGREGVRFLNINADLADADGLLLDTMSSDGLHLSKAGYAVWAEALRPVLTELLGPPAADDQAPPPTGNPAALLQAE
jgi:lysophospholipase L1-like esterase